MKHFRVPSVKILFALLLASSAAFAAVQTAHADSPESDKVATPSWELSRRLVAVSECKPFENLIGDYYVETTFEIQKVTLSMEAPVSFVSTFRLILDATPIFDISEPQIFYKDSYLKFSKTSRASALDTCIAMRGLLVKNIK